MRRTLLALLGSITLAAPASALQTATPAPDTTGAFMDAGAARLLARARAARHRSDRSIRSYTAVVKSRISAGLRMPLKDRTLFRSESAARARWSRDGAHVVQVLAARNQHPGGVEIPQNPSGIGIDELFDPARDRMYFGIGSPDSADSGDDGDFYIEHPISDHAERFYRFQSGDTLTLRLQDGRTLRTVELIIIPRYQDPHTVRGVVWLEAETGSLVQAAFRLARTVDILRDLTDAVEDEDAGRIPGFLKPMEFDISLMTVEYSLWDMQHWLPRIMRVEGMARAGAFRAPAAFEISYDMEDVVADDGASNVVAEAAAADSVQRAWNVGGDYEPHDHRHDSRRIMVLIPRDSMRLVDPAVLPPPIWEDAPGFLTEGELKQMEDRLAEIGRSMQRQDAMQNIPLHFGWGFGEPEMVRYNRVEALSLGARASLPLPSFEVVGTARIGIGDLHPNAELLLRRQTPRRTWELRGYHQLAAVDGSDAFGMGNSVSALVLGRDEGEYYRSTGGMITLAPAWVERRSWEMSIYAEHQDDVERNTHIALPRAWNDSVFRRNIVADDAQQYGAMIRLQPWWGTDPMAAQFGLDMMIQGETGDFEHARARATLRAAAPLVQGLRLGLEAGAGTSAGDVPVQRRFYLGGASTLRGYDASTVSGTSMARARVELARTYNFANLAVFSDWGWAGRRPRELSDIRNEDTRLSVGVGASLLDGLLRLDLAHGLRAPRGWRIDLHMDAIL